MTTSLGTAGVPDLQIDEQIAILRLRRPDQANRLELSDLEVLQQHFRWLSARRAEVRALVVTGTGKHFSAGFDLGAIDSAVEGDASQIFAAMVDALENLPQVTICAINGGVFGGSTDLALACDIRLGVPQTRMFMPAARIGLHYYESGLRRYCTRLGLDNAKRLCLLAEEFDAPALQQIGYLTRIVPHESLMNEALVLARRAADMAPLARANMKATLNAMAAGRYDPQQGARGYAECMASADLKEGIAALREKRATKFEGR